MSFITESDIQVSCGTHTTRILHKPSGRIFSCGYECDELGYHLSTCSVPQRLNILRQVILSSKIKYINSERYGLVAYDISGRRYEWSNMPSAYIELSPEMKSFVSDTYLPHTISYGIAYKLFLCKDNNLYIRGDNGRMGIKYKDGLKLIKFPDCSFNPKIIQIASVSAHSFVLTTTGLYSWGRNLHGVLGLGNESHYTIPTKIDLPRVIFISICDDHTIALDNNNDVWSWGCNESGQLGLGDKNNRFLPQKLVLHNIVSVACGPSYTIALDSNGSLYSWGSNGYGQLGLGDTNDRLSPEKIELKDIISVTCGMSYTIAVDIYSKIYVWGCNTEGQLGLGDYKNRSTPQLLEFKC